MEMFVVVNEAAKLHVYSLAHVPLCLMGVTA